MAASPLSKCGLFYYRNFLLQFFLGLALFLFASGSYHQSALTIRPVLKRSASNQAIGDEESTRNQAASSIDFDASHRIHPAVVESGDIMFGGLFPVHDKGENKPCGTLNSETGFQRLLAMMYAVDKLNKEDNVLPGIKIGIHAHDTCQNDIYAMERVLEFIAMRSRSLRGTLDIDDHATLPGASLSSASALSSFASSLSFAVPTTSLRPSLTSSSSATTTIVRSMTSTLRKPIVAVIGPAQSSITTAVASVLRLFQIPQISYAATSTELSDRTRFDYFFRVVPPDNLQAEVMAAVVHSLKWRYVWAIGDEGPYGYKGVKSFAEAIDHWQEFFIPRNAKDKFFDDLIDKMASNERARGVVLFCNEANIRRLLQATVRRGRTSQFYWLASDSWGAKQRLVQGLEEVADGAITILPQKELIHDFDRYMRLLEFRCNDPRMAARNPWLQEYWEQLNNCSCKANPPVSNTNSNFKRCPDSNSLLNKPFRQEGLVQFVIDSVYALAHALRNIQRIYCGEMYVGLCSNMKRVMYNGTLVRDFIQNVSFFGISKTPIHFNSEGGVEGKYEVYQFRLRKNGTYEYVKTGWWNPKDGLALHQPHVRGTIQTFCARGSFDDPMPVSYCSDSCPSDQGYEYTSDSQCCWHCERCHKNQFLNTSTRKCVECPEDELQSSTRVFECEKIRFVHIDWATIWPCIPIALSCLGLLLNTFILYTLLRYNKTPIIKASGRESSAILLTGLTATFTTIILQPLWPSLVSCAIMRLGMPVSLTMCYASIFTKTHRIYRIFLPSLNNLIHRPPFISPKSQIIMSLLCTGVSLLLSIVCLTLEPPEVEYLTHNLPETIVRCKIKNTTFFLTFIYDILVIVATTSLAWQVRSIPENFNEAKYIAFLMYSSCVVWIGLMPIYFLVTSNYTVQMTSFLLCITLSAIDIQVCMFLPKVYIVYTGKDPLQRGGKVKFSYATARPQTPSKHNEYHPRNPASLAMAIIKSSGAPTNNNDLLNTRRLTAISSVTTPPTLTMEDGSAQGNASDNSHNKNLDATIHENGEDKDTKTDPPSSPPPPKVIKNKDNKKSANHSLLDEDMVKTDGDVDSTLMSPMVPVAVTRSCEERSPSTGGSKSVEKRITAPPKLHSKPLPPYHQESEPCSRSSGKFAPDNNHSSNSSLSVSRQPRHQQSEQDNRAPTKRRHRRPLSQRQKRGEHSKLIKNYSSKTACIGNSPSRRNSANPLFYSRFDNDDGRINNQSPSARSLSNHRSCDEGERDDDERLLAVVKNKTDSMRSPTLPVKLPEALMKSANKSASENNHYSSSTSLFFGRKGQRHHHLPTQSFTSMKPAGLVVVTPPAMPPPASGSSPLIGSKAKSGKRYAVAATLANSSSTTSRSSVRSNLVEPIESNMRQYSSGLMNGLVNGWADLIDEGDGTRRGTANGTSLVAQQKRRLMKKRSPFAASIDGEQHLPLPLPTNSLKQASVTTPLVASKMEKYSNL